VSTLSKAFFQQSGNVDRRGARKKPRPRRSVSKKLPVVAGDDKLQIELVDESAGQGFLISGGLLFRASSVVSSLRARHQARVETPSGVDCSSPLHSLARETPGNFGRVLLRRGLAKPIQKLAEKHQPATMFWLSRGHASASRKDCATSRINRRSDNWNLRTEIPEATIFQSDGLVEYHSSNSQAARFRTCCAHARSAKNR